ncbi:unnamed protein product [Pleuronectes platessa]|uniref:Uncharacterized protein n=1 Tax=Pleuronectes platessa TaxID=8262 RepID=A0A9N7U1W6_PLEPL|nr:unnamed protein product [Pleuronectes platessa]
MLDPQRQRDRQLQPSIQTDRQPLSLRSCSCANGRCDFPFPRLALPACVRPFLPGSDIFLPQAPDLLLLVGDASPPLTSAPTHSAYCGLSSPASPLLLHYITVHPPLPPLPSLAAARPLITTSLSQTDREGRSSRGTSECIRPKRKTGKEHRSVSADIGMIPHVAQHETSNTEANQSHRQSSSSHHHCTEVRETCSTFLGFTPRCVTGGEGKEGQERREGEKGRREGTVASV